MEAPIHLAESGPYRMLAARMLRALLGFCLALSIQLVALLAHGQGTPADRALANDLFQRARKALLEQKYTEACPLLEESQRLDPAGGTLLNLALCHENLGLTATAWTEFHDALAIARHERRSDRAEFALAHIAALETRLSRLIIEPENPVAPGLVIERDGSVLRASVWGKPMPVDPGEHSVRAQAPGFESFEQSVRVGEAGDTQTVRIPALTPLLTPSPEPQPEEVLPREPTVVVPPPSPAPKPAPLPAPPPNDAAPAKWKAPLAWSLFALSLASAVTATVTGVRAIKLRNDAEGRCSDGQLASDERECSDRAFELDDQAQRHAHASTALTALGVLSGAGGLFVWFVPGNTNSVHGQKAEDRAEPTRGAREPVAKLRALGVGFATTF